MRWRQKLGAYLLALLVANPTCCCFGKWLQELTFQKPAPPSCCSGSETDTPTSPLDENECTCSMNKVTQAKQEIALSSSLRNLLISSIPVAFLQVGEFSPKSVASPLPLDDPPRKTVPLRLTYQAFLL